MQSSQLVKSSRLVQILPLCGFSDGFGLSESLALSPVAVRESYTARGKIAVTVSQMHKRNTRGGHGENGFFPPPVHSRICNSSLSLGEVPVLWGGLESLRSWWVLLLRGRDRRPGRAT